ncbi:MAG: class I SAM-dependent methyltransferase [Pseudomonadota bacterium]
MSSKLSELRTLWRLLRGSASGVADHGARMESFYAAQAEDYDAFRKRLLTGRERLLERLELPPGAVVADLGGGTGANLDFLPAGMRAQLGHWHIVDLAGSLLRIADQRIAELGASNVTTHRADATLWRPADHPVDIVLLSYSLTMMPDWPAVLEHAESLLRPGGQIAVVDFYVSRKHPPPGMVRHSWWTRHGWTAWFGWDDVFLSADHLPTLSRRFEPVWRSEDRAPVPWLPWVRVPVYQFIGRKKGSDAPQ